MPNSQGAHSRIIMMRTYGNMREATSYQQHLNPACRVARAHPHLPIARLLMSIQDVDVPLESDADRKIASQVPMGMFLYYYLASMLEFCGHLPYPTQDGLTEMTTIIAVNGIGYGIFAASQVSMSGAYAIIAVCLALMVSGTLIKMVKYTYTNAKRLFIYVEKRAEDAVLADINNIDPDGEFNEFDNEEADTESKIGGKASNLASSAAGDMSPENQLLMALRATQSGTVGRAVPGRIRRFPLCTDLKKITSPVGSGKLFEQRSPLPMPSGASLYSYTSPMGPGTSIAMQTPGTVGSISSQMGGPPTLPQGPPAMMGATTGISVLVRTTVAWHHCIVLISAEGPRSSL